MSARVTLRGMHFLYFPMSNVNMHLFKSGTKVLSLRDVGLYSVSSKVYTQFLQRFILSFFQGLHSVSSKDYTQFLRRFIRSFFQGLYSVSSKL